MDEWIRKKSFSGLYLLLLLLVALRKLLFDSIAVSNWIIIRDHSSVQGNWVVNWHWSKYERNGREKNIEKVAKKVEEISCIKCPLIFLQEYACHFISFSSLSFFTIIIRNWFWWPYSWPSHPSYEYRAEKKIQI